MTEAYTIRDLAEELDIAWQTLAAWKKHNRIPADAILPDGMYDKTIIAPLVEEFKNTGNRPEPIEVKLKPASRKPASRKPAAKKVQKVETPTVDFDEFVRQYWQKGGRAVDVLLMPKEAVSMITEHVNEALKYAYEKLEK